MHIQRFPNDTQWVPIDSYPTNFDNIVYDQHLNALMVELEYSLPKEVKAIYWGSYASNTLFS